MNPNILSNGEQLRIGILKYSTAKSSRLWINVLLCFLPPAILILLIQYNAYLFILILIGFGSFFSLAFGFAFLFVNMGEGSVYDFKQLGNIMKGSVCYFAVDDKSQYIIIEFFTPSELLVNKNEQTKPLIDHIFRILLPHYSSKDLTIYIQFYAMPTINVQPENSIMDELEKIVDGELNRNGTNLPNDIKVYISEETYPPNSVESYPPVSVQTYPPKPVQ